MLEKPVAYQSAPTGIAAQREGGDNLQSALREPFVLKLSVQLHEHGLPLAFVALHQNGL